jgi:hypothetical protein
VNSVVGGGIRHPSDALTIARRARELGFMTTVGIIHDGRGHLMALADEQRAILEQLAEAGSSMFDYANYNRFQRNLAVGQPNDWHCRAGSRYLYVCEDGLVHWCSQQRGRPGVPLEQYTDDDLRREYHAEKGCAPFCTVGCVHRVAQVDELRQSPDAALSQWFAPRAGGGNARVPAPVRLLRWAFVTSQHRGLFRRAATAMFDTK